MTTAKMQWVSFFLIFLSIYAVLHFYIYRRLVFIFNLSLTGKLVIAICFVLLGSSYILGRAYDGGLDFLISPGAYWMGAIQITFSVLFLFHILGIILARQNPALQKTFGMIALALSVAATLISIQRASHVVIRDIKINVNKKFDGPLSVVQLTDVHLGRLKDAKWFAGIVEKVNALHPDLILLTGDVVDDLHALNDEFKAQINALQSKLGVYATPGNHEYYIGIDYAKMFFKSTQVKFLFNESRKIRDDLFVAAVTDPQAPRLGYPGPDIGKAFKNVSAQTSPLVIFLSHRPSYVTEAKERGADLQLSGHTHKGQIFPGEVFVLSMYRYPYGLYHLNNFWIYTSSGTGTWGPRMRSFSRSEIVHFTIIPANK